MGAEHVVVTRGAEGAVLRGGGMRMDVPGAPARAGQHGGRRRRVLRRRCSRGWPRTDFYPPAIAAALPEAVAEAARAVERWGAL